MIKVLIPLFCVAVGLAACSASPLLPTQADFSLDRYVGRWYEQARLPNRFQKECVGEVTADYTLLAETKLRVVNQCRNASGAQRVAQAEGRLARVDPVDPAKLEVRFAPAWLGWLPVVWGDYWVIHVDDDYRYALVGTPNRQYLWVLSRAQQADPERVALLVSEAHRLGFAVEGVQYASSSPP